MTTIETLQNRLTEVIKSRFPDSYLRMSVSTLGSLNRPSLIVSFALESGPDKWPNHIIHNDPGHTIFLIHSKKCMDGSLCDLQLDGSIHGYRHKSGKYDKLKWRDLMKPTTEDAIVKQITRYFDNMRQTLTVNC